MLVSEIRKGLVEESRPVASYSSVPRPRAYAVAALADRGELLAYDRERKAAAIADFDGNGHDDLLWTNIEPDAASDNGHLLMWLMRADGGFEGSYVGSYPKGWRVVNSTY